jgi:hypothetical protein
MLTCSLFVPLDTYLLCSAVVNRQEDDEYAHIFDEDPITNEMLWELHELEQQQYTVQVSGAYIYSFLNSQPHI